MNLSAHIDDFSSSIVLKERGHHSVDDLFEVYIHSENNFGLHECIGDIYPLYRADYGTDLPTGGIDFRQGWYFFGDDVSVETGQNLIDRAEEHFGIDREIWRFTISVDMYVQTDYLELGFVRSQEITNWLEQESDRIDHYYKLLRRAENKDFGWSSFSEKVFGSSTYLDDRLTGLMPISKVDLMAVRYLALRSDLISAKHGLEDLIEQAPVIVE